MPSWLTLTEAAEYLRMGKSTLYKLLREAKLPGYKAGKVWRFSATELDAWIKAGRRDSVSGTLKGTDNGTA